MNPLRLAPFALVPALLMLGGCDSQADSSATAPRPRAVLVAEVQAASQQDALYTGVVAARTASDLGFRVGGKVIARNVDPGTRVKRGDVLLVLDNTDFELALRAARNRVSAAEAELRQARDDEARYRRLAGTGAVSRQVFDQAATRLRVAQADRAAAVSEAAQVENRRTYSTLKADADGVITDVRVDRGQVVAEGQIVASLAHDGAREAVIDIPETQRTLAGHSARAYPYGASGDAVPAQLRELSAAADTTTRTFRARYTLGGDSSALAIGSTVTLRLDGDARQRQVRVPLGALHDKGQGAGVWVIDAQSRVKLRPVRVARLEQEEAVLEGGVQPGERIVALGAHLLNADDPVRELPAPELALER
ncbi:efflux RND transporter periplasmic adaptor subunit [Metapseudomonas furukawaii]|uniref:Component of multidrug efflux system n=1 Tax=Metapseudomonas furukawaii TaxID=1149133 RepID=A0AAD1C593_METFU|nr:efflux RND transporter periplasmic adaptor subunit [Pseudomonas furukawaii]ELS25154.1 HlyD family secretion protein [Pseudomonas furukawaii]BAU75819.1 component of multidrug efflux system [Pseudomonas furukawaii]